MNTPCLQAKRFRFAATVLIGGVSISPGLFTLSAALQTDQESSNRGARRTRRHQTPAPWPLLRLPQWPLRQAPPTVECAFVENCSDFTKPGPVGSDTFPQMTPDDPEACRRVRKKIKCISVTSCLPMAVELPAAE